ncbi:helix-turn-helix transcriptional regulator [Catellatospora sp. NPDC049609]|uniref:helix-turn-helix transcriptional regulator n=1 Tax=Catellatospora sp. NPDC049609 TaxID=3155505 RepID=UPI00341A32D4
MSQDADAMRQLFGLVLRHLRKDAAWSLRELARRCLYDYSRISRVERGEHLIDADLVPALDEALRADGLLITLRALIPRPGALATTPHARLRAGLRMDGGDTVALEFTTPNGRVVRMDLPRREFNNLLAGGALRALLPAGVADLDQAERVGSAIGEPRRTDSQVLDYFRTLLDQHFVADKVLGPRDLLGVVLAQIGVLDRLRRGSRPGCADATTRLLAQYAEFAGWLHQDLGDTDAAKHWTDRATRCAQAIGDYELVSYLLVRRSNIALLGDDARDVIELAAAARRVPGPVSPTLLALAAQQEARGWAMHADADQFRRLLDTAANLLRSRVDGVDERTPVYLHSYNLDVLEEQSASGFRACGQAETAIAILERRIVATPDHHHRDRAHQLAKLANSVLQTAQPDPERAAELGLSCIGPARDTGSARIASELRALDRNLTKRWRGLRGTMALREALAAV